MINKARLKNWLENNLKGSVILKKLYKSSSLYSSNKLKEELIKQEINNLQLDYLLDESQKETFNFKKFLSIKGYDEKALYTVLKSRAEDSISIDTLNGLLMFMSQETNIPMALLINDRLLSISREYNDKNFNEFMEFNQNLDGSIGIMNPLKDGNIDSLDLKKWLVKNSLFTYAFLG